MQLLTSLVAIMSWAHKSTPHLLLMSWLHPQSHINWDDYTFHYLFICATVHVPAQYGKLKKDAGIAVLFTRVRDCCVVQIPSHCFSDGIIPTCSLFLCFVHQWTASLHHFLFLKVFVLVCYISSYPIANSATSYWCRPRGLVHWCSRVRDCCVVQIPSHRFSDSIIPTCSLFLCFVAVSLHHFLCCR